MENTLGVGGIFRRRITGYVRLVLSGQFARHPIAFGAGAARASVSDVKGEISAVDIPIFSEAGAKHVYVVVSRSRSLLSGAIIAVTGDGYTHAALALDRELEYMYSFGRRNISNPFVGCFKRERLSDRFYTRHKSLPGAVLELPLSQAQHRGIVDDIREFAGGGHGYNIRGMMTAMFARREPARDDKFFCSEFVYHVLRKNGVCDLGVPRSAVRPQHLLALDAERIFDGDLLLYPRETARAGEPLPSLT